MSSENTLQGVMIGRRGAISRCTAPHLLFDADVVQRHAAHPLLVVTMRSSATPAV